VDVQRQVRRLGPNSSGEELAPGAVDDCSLGLLVDQPLAATLPAPGSLLVVGPNALLDDRVRQPDGRVVYDLVTGHPDREPRELVFLADLAVELRTWQGTDWVTLGWMSRRWLRRWCCWPAAATSRPLVPLARRRGSQGAWPASKAKALGRPAMEYARAELRRRLAGWRNEHDRRWLHPSSGRRPGKPFL
jgi:hypothetical protein